MGMPISIEIADTSATKKDFDDVFAYFTRVDETFSVYKDTSEITRINNGELPEELWSEEMKEVFAYAEETKQATDGYFDIVRADGTYDPSGIVKGWAIHNAAVLLTDKGFTNFCIDAGGDIELSGNNSEGLPWRVGIRNPWSGVKDRLFDKEKDTLVKVIAGSAIGVATSGSYLLGSHIYNPHERNREIADVVSLTVIGPNVYEADRFATAAFAMGREGIYFIEQLPGFEGYMIDREGIATATTNFSTFVVQ